MSKEPHEMTASELSALFASRDLSPVEVTEGCIGRIEALDAEINAFCHFDPEASLAHGRSVRGALAGGRAAVAARRRAGRGEGSAADQGLADAARLADRRSQRLYRHRCADGGAAARSGRGADRQDHDAGIRLEGLDRQPAHRHHAQSLEQGEDARRLLRRHGGGARRAVSVRSGSAPMAAARSAFRRVSPAPMASSRASAACRPIRCRPSARSPMSAR